MKVLCVFVLFAIFATLSVAKRIELYRIDARQALAKDFIPVYSSVDDFAESLVEEKADNANLVLLKRFKSSPQRTQELRNIEPTEDVSTSSGRTFKHFLLLKSLLNSGSGSGIGGGSNGFIYPIIINTPLNLTNVNNNTVTNTPAEAPAAGGGGGGGAAGGADGQDVRINFLGFPQMQQWPMQMQMPMSMPMQDIKMPTQVYHQREAGTSFPMYSVAMLNMPGLSPMPITQYVKDNNYQKEQRKVLRWPNAYNRSPQNPFAAFANSFRGIQFL